MKLITIILLFFSCSSPAPDPIPTFCWKCTTTTIVKITPNSASVGTSERDVCGFTDSQIHELELAGTHDDPSAYVEIKCSRK